MKYNYLFLLLIASVFFGSQSSTIAQPSSGLSSDIDVSEYPWIQSSLNRIQFYDRSSLEHFQKSWKNASVKRVSIMMFGDSHLQSEVYPRALRKRIQEKLGMGGLGLMFPFSIAKTYSSIEYRCSHTGVWTSQRSYALAPKLPMGVRGMTCRTVSAPASFTFQFYKEVPEHYTLLKIFCKKVNNSFDLEIVVSGQKYNLNIEKDPSSPYIELRIPPITDRKIVFNVVRKNSSQTEFELYGISLEAEEDKGVIVHNAGVGSARYSSMLNQSLLIEQLPHFNTDLAIIDFGTNDFVYYDKIQPELEREIRKVIKLVREAAPDASIILTSAQDLYYRRQNCRASAPFSDLIHRIAAETNCAVYDWYWIAGGQGVMKDWVESKLAAPDYIHLSNTGYTLKGELFYEAIRNCLFWLDENPDKKSFLLDVSELRAKQIAICEKLATNPTALPASKPAATAASSSGPSGTVLKNYTIASGDSLYSIGKKFGVTVDQIKSWNGLSSDKIIAGKTLKIYLKK